MSPSFPESCLKFNDAHILESVIRYVESLSIETPGQHAFQHCTRLQFLSHCNTAFIYPLLTVSDIFSASPRGVVANVKRSDIVVSNFKLQMHLAQPGAVEYTNCTSTMRYDPVKSKIS